MKDRTLLIMAVLFLIFSIGGGVNKSLEAGNRTMGEPMALDLKLLYHSYVPGFMMEINKHSEIGRNLTYQIYKAEFPLVIGKANKVKTEMSLAVKSRLENLRDRLYYIYNQFLDKSRDEKNMLLMQ